jgi:hypothetical protein
MMCLVAAECFDVQWDQLEPIPGPGRRFDFRAVGSALRGIFEAKGTKYRGSQFGQISDGLAKKAKHRTAGETYDAAIIVSTHIGIEGEHPRIVVADPPRRYDEAAFAPGSEQMFRSRHYSRVLQFAGLTEASRELYLQSQQLLAEPGLPARPLNAVRSNRNVTRQIGGTTYVGRWVTESDLPDSFVARVHASRTRRRGSQARAFRLFQGVDEEILDRVQSREWDLLKVRPFREAGAPVREAMDIDSNASRFPDGSILTIEELSR